MPIFPPDSPFMAGFMKLFDAFTSAVRNFGDCDVYADKIDRWDFANSMALMVELATPTRGGFQILNHGDLWLNNMMFKSDAEGNPLEVSLIDYQMPFWASPANDLLYFLISSAADDIKIKYFDEFIEFYHGQLVESLKKLKYTEKNVPTLAELHIDILDKGGIGKFDKFERRFIHYIFYFYSSWFTPHVYTCYRQVRFERGNNNGRVDGGWRLRSIQCTLQQRELQEGAQVVA